MKAGHLRATLWLRWRILVNRLRRRSKLGNMFFGLLLVLALCASVSFFFVALFVGLEHLPEAAAKPVMLVWVALALGFLFFWLIGLVTDLQRSDAMSFKHLLHLPVSLHWIFLYNYLSSFVSLSVAIFLPAMLGLWLAMAIVKGPLMLLALPLILGYFGMITALTYQLRGWLAHLMEDKRRGRNIMAAITVGFVLLLQVPNLINMSTRSSNREERSRVRQERYDLRDAAREEGPEQAAAQAAYERFQGAEEQKDLEQDRNTALVAKIVPLGWLPYGMRATYEASWVPGILCSLGLLLITALSLRRSYRTTVASIVGADSHEEDAELTAGAPGQTADAGTEADHKPKTLLVQRELPLVGEQVAGIATMGLRSLLRAPEAKMLLLSPVILLVLFGMLLSKESTRGALGSFAPMMSLGAIMMGLVSIFQLVQNQFGLDRDGFRAYVLSPVPRHRILMGKNLSTAPLGIGIGLIALGGMQFFVPSDVDHFLGALFQLCSAYMLMCLVGNATSILSPIRLKEHGLKAANAKLKTMLWQTLSLILVLAALSPLALPELVVFVLSKRDWAAGLPLFLMLHAAGAIVTYVLYRWVLIHQGQLLQEREQHILDVLTHD